MLPLPQTAMILGMGYIGRAIAGILCQHGITVLGVDKSPSPERKTACDELLDNTNWRRHLHRTDLCFIALPLTGSTANIFDEAALKALPSHAVLVNVGRGGIVDTNALVRQLRNGHLGGAALDVIDPIPETPTDPIWKTPRLLITPKVSVFYPGRQRKLEEYIEIQVKRYLDGKQLLHKVDINALAE
jgi:phosphoglycerate dehydrogenase-like enzyme